jgi:hypothetical protein
MDSHNLKPRSSSATTKRDPSGNFGRITSVLSKSSPSMMEKKTAGAEASRGCYAVHGLWTGLEAGSGTWTAPGVRELSLGGKGTVGDVSERMEGLGRSCPCWGPA